MKQKLQNNKNLSQNAKKLLGEPDAANFIGVPYSTLKFWRRIGKVEFYKTSSGRIAYSTEQLKQFKSEAVAA
jgi:predicted site-specific integrase-resolvase